MMNEKTFENLFKGGIVLWILLALGWIINIISVVSQISSDKFAEAGEMSTLLIIQIVGIFVAPAGSILGYISLFL